MFCGRLVFRATAAQAIPERCAGVAAGSLTGTADVQQLQMLPAVGQCCCEQAVGSCVVAVRPLQLTKGAKDCCQAGRVAPSSRVLVRLLPAGCLPAAAFACTAAGPAPVLLPQIMLLLPLLQLKLQVDCAK